MPAANDRFLGGSAGGRNDASVVLARPGTRRWNSTVEPATIDQAKAVLYGQPVESFVAERNALVKAIRTGGDRALANEVKALRRPSAVAAEVNRIVRADPDGVDLILQAAALLRAVQSGAVDGTVVNASELQQQYRAAVQALAQSATDRRAEVRAALEAATIDEASNEDLRSGCLVVVPSPVSVFGSTAPTDTEPETRPPTEQPVDELEKRRALHRSEKAAANDAAAVQAAANEAAAQAKAAAEEAARQRKEAEKARRKERKKLQSRQRDARRAHLAAIAEEEAASLAVERANQELVEADEEIDAAEAALAELRVRRVQTIAERDRNEQAKTEAGLRAAEAQAVLDDCAETLRALDD
jgi:hypothetical protein